MDLVHKDEKRKRLLVLLPESLAGNQELAHKVYWLASRYRYDVHYLTMVNDHEQVLQVHRFMITTAAITANSNLKVDWEWIETFRWHQRLKELACAGDIIVCLQEQTVRTGLFRTIPVSDFLHNDSPHLQVITISGIHLPQKDQTERGKNQLFTMIWALVSLVFFTFLEIQVDVSMAGFGRKAVLILLICLEAGVFYAWNSIKSR